MNEFALDGDDVIINVPCAEAYIPAKLFTESESAIASFDGDTVRILGMFNMRFFDSEESVDDRDSFKLETIAYSDIIASHPTSYEKETLTLEGITDEFYVLKYYMGDIFMKQSSEANILNCEMFMDALLKAKLPRSLNYDTMPLAWLENFDRNGFDPGVNACVLQIIISENARYVGDQTQPFRKYAAYAESYSNHPISKSLQRAYGKEIRKEEIANSEEKAGMGVITKWKETTIYAGNEKLMKWLAKNQEILVTEKDGKKMMLNKATDASVIKSLFHVDKAGTICHIAIEENFKITKALLI